MPLDETQLSDLLVTWEEQLQQGRSVTAAELCRECPELSGELELRIAWLQRMNRLADSIQADKLPRSSQETASHGNTDLGSARSTAGLAATLEVGSGGLENRAGSMPDWPKIIGYEILGLLGEGGMGAVYKARDVKLDRPVALKVIRETLPTSKQRERFHVEAQAVAKLQHPNIVQIFGIGEWQPTEGGSPLPYLALEYVEGDNLEHRAGDKPMPPGEAAHIVLQLAQAMQHAHSRGIIHRDLKPANVLMQATDSEGAKKDKETRKQGDKEREDNHFGSLSPCLPVSLSPKIADFGLARKPQGNQRLTQTGVVVGTPAYMSPEQVDGLDVGPATDIYALGAILYRLLTGQVLFKGKSVVDTLFRVCKEPPVPPRQLVPYIPAQLEAICLRCLAKDPAKRYPSAGDLAAALEDFLKGPAATVILPRAELEARPPARAGRRRLAGIAVLVLALVGISGWLLRDRHGEDPPPLKSLETPLTTTSRPPEEPPQLPLLKVTHYRINEDRTSAKSFRLGEVDVNFGDGVVLNFETKEPLYYYLLAFHPNGQEQLLWPCDDMYKGTPEVVPPRLPGLRSYPKDDNWLLLDDEPAGGLEAIVLAASRQPLPAYEQWKTLRTAVPWSRLPGGKQFWRADDSGTYPMPKVGGIERSVGKGLVNVPPLTTLCKALKSGGVEAVEAIAFPVKPKPKGP